MFFYFSPQPRQAPNQTDTQCVHQICLWGSPSLRVTNYASGYAYGVAPASESPAMPFAMPMG